MCKRILPSLPQPVRGGCVQHCRHSDRCLKISHWSHFQSCPGCCDPHLQHTNTYTHAHQNVRVQSHAHADVRTIFTEVGSVAHMQQTRGCIRTHTHRHTDRHTEGFRFYPKLYCKRCDSPLKCTGQHVFGWTGRTNRPTDD